MLAQESEVMLSDRWNSSLFKYVLTLSREPFTQMAPTVTKALKDSFQNLTLFVHTNTVKIVYFHNACHAYKISLFLTLRFASCIMAENLEWQKCSLSRYLPAIFNEQLFALVSWPIVSACVCTPRSHYSQRVSCVLSQSAWTFSWSAPSKVLAHFHATTRNASFCIQFANISLVQQPSLEQARETDF